MATSFKLKAQEELRKAKQEQREQEASAHAQSVAAKYAKNVANEKRIADKMVRIEKSVVPVSEVETIVETPVVEEEAVVEKITVEKIVEKPKPKAKPDSKKRGRPAKAKK